MPSSHNAHLMPLAALMLSAALLLIGCVEETSPADVDPCDTSIANYENVGAPMMLTWCVPCHSSQLEEGLRQDATVDINFDTYEGVRSQLDRIYARAIEAVEEGGSAMPPGGGPSKADLNLLAEWIDCEAPL